MNLQEYIKKQYGNDVHWFVEETKQPYNESTRMKIIAQKQYLKGVHQISTKPDATWNGKEFKTSKMILQNAKAYSRFHSTLLMGKNVSLSGSENLVQLMNTVYRGGQFHKSNYQIVDDLYKFGNAYEYIYIDGGQIKSKVLAPEDCNVILTERGEYIGLVESYTDSLSNISTYIVYSEDTVETWSDENGELIRLCSVNNLSGLPVHYKTTFDCGYGDSKLEDIKPIIDNLEELLNKYKDSVQTLSMNPIAYTSGMRLIESVPVDSTYCIALDDGGQMGYVQAVLDYNSCKLLLDQLTQHLCINAGIPSVILGQSNVSNVSEISLELLYQLSYSVASETEMFLNNFEGRHMQIIKLLRLLGNSVGESEYLQVIYNYSKPTDTTVTIENIKKMFDSGLMSKKSAIELNPMISDSGIELNRIIEGYGNDGNTSVMID